MTSDNDSDYSDAEDEVELENIVARDKQVNKDGISFRGKDVNWVEVYRFATHESEIGKKIADEFTVRKDREFEYADVKIHHCKFSRRVGFKPCPWNFKVSFLAHSSDVVVETNDGLEHHIHEVDEEYNQNPGAVFKWTDEMNKIIKNSEMNHNKPNKTLRLLNEANVFISRRPTKIQLYNKCAAIRKTLNPTINMVNTHQMRQKIQEVLNVPESEVEGFVPFWEIDDENDNKEPRFCVIFATKKSQATLSSIDFLQPDATYRLNWMGFPVFVFGECVLFILCMCIHISPRFLGLDSHGLHVIIIMHVFTVWSFGSPFLLNSYSQYLQCAFFTLMSSHHVEMQISLSSDYDFT